MKSFTITLLKQFIFWILFYALLRSIFLLYHFDLLLATNAGIGEIFLSYTKAFRLDLSAFCYTISIPFILLIPQLFLRRNFFNRLAGVFSILIIVVNALILVSELGVYNEWRTKLYYKALLYLSNPSEVINTAETGKLIILIMIFFLVSGSTVFVYLKWFFPKVEQLNKNYLITIVLVLALPFFIVLGYRGGLQPIPINQSDVYYSRHQLLNLAATNSLWNLSYSIQKNYGKQNHNPFNFYPDAEAQSIVRKIYSYPKYDNISIFDTLRPNIVLLIMEGWAADMSGALGGRAGYMPNFDSLTKHGLLFTKFYACGTRSQQAMSALIGGFPSLPLLDVTNNIEKYSKLPSISRKLKNEGYSNSFIFGGQLTYGNIKSYLSNNQFDILIELQDFDDKLPKGKLGVHDEYVLKRQIREANKFKQPFFSVVFTLSSHSPYDIPVKKKKFENDVEANYSSGIFYSDSCLGLYFDEAKKQRWFGNTIFIIVGDHSHETYKQLPYGVGEYFRIPLLIVGNPLMPEYRGTSNSKIGSQYDLPATILNQLNIDCHEFEWSKNLLNPIIPEFAYYTTSNHGLGWIRPNANFMWDKNYDQYPVLIIPAEQKDSVIKEGKSFLQVLFKKYLDF